MSKAIITAKAYVYNTPISIATNEDRFMVARGVDGEMWYYGMYETYERALEVADELTNGVVLEVDHE